MDYFKLFTGNSTLVWTFVHKLWFLRNTIAPSLFVQENMNMQWINLDCNSCCKMLFRLIFSWLLLLAITHTKVCDWFFLHSIHITLAFWILFWKTFLRLHCDLYFVPNIEFETQPTEIASRSHISCIENIFT